jgi:hypothetical protein
MTIDPTLLSPVSALLGATVGGAASLLGAIYTQRRQDRIQRIASERWQNGRPSMPSSS